VLLTCTGKRYDIVACFAAITHTVAADPNPLAPAQYAAHARVAVPTVNDPHYVPALASICEQHGVGAVLPLTDLDIEVLAHARADGLLPAFVPSPEVARQTFDKYDAHLLFGRAGLPSPPTILPTDDIDTFVYPAVVKPRRGSGARSIHFARNAREARFFVEYVQSASPAEAGGDVKVPAGEPVLLQRAMGGDEFSIDCLGDLTGRCLNAIPRTMVESRGGESVKGTVVRDSELIDLAAAAMEALQVSGPATIQVFRDPEIGIAITDFNTRFGGAFPAPMYAAQPGQTYPELIVRMAEGEAVAPHVGRFVAPVTFTRYYWQLELDGELEPTGRQIVPGGPPAPRR
jgi:carbamoyl-phosphate synthase large subunit